MSVKTPPIVGNDSSLTLVKVRGWCRYGFGNYDFVSKEWELRFDPAVYLKNVDNITHWLRVPKNYEKK